MTARTRRRARLTSNPRRARRVQLGGEAEARFHNLVEVSPTAIAILQGSRLVFANQALAELTGYPLAELDQMSMWKLTPTASQTTVERLGRASLTADGQPSRLELPLQRADESVIWVTVQFKPTRLNGQPAVIASLLDVTERVQVETSLQERITQLEVLRQMSLEWSAVSENGRLYQTLVDQTRRLLACDYCGLYLLHAEEDVLELTAASGPELLPLGAFVRRGEGLSGKVWAARRPQVVTDARVAAPGRAGAAAYTSAGTPILWQDELLGVLTVAAASPHAGFSPIEVELLSLFTYQAAATLHNLDERARLLAEQHRIAAMARLAARLNANVTSVEVTAVVCEETALALASPVVTVRLVEAGSGRLCHAAGYGEPPEAEIEIPGYPYDALALARRPEKVFVLALPDLPTSPFRPSSMAIAKIVYEERLLGTLNVVRAASDPPFGHEELAFLHALTEQAALALGHAELYEETRRQAERQRLIAEITQATLQVDVRQPALDLMVTYIGQASGADGCFLALWQSDRQEFSAGAAYGELAAGFMQVSLAEAPPPFLAALRSGEPLVVGDTRQPGSGLDATVAAALPFKSLLGLPLAEREASLGIILLAYLEARRFSLQEVNEWREIAQQVSLAIIKVRLLEVERRRWHEAEVLGRTTARLMGSLNLEEIWQELCAALHSLVPFERAALLLRLEEALEVAAVEGYDPARWVGTQLKLETPIFVRLNTHQRPVILADARRDPDFQPWAVSADPPRSWLGAPLLDEEAVVGILILADSAPNRFTPAQADLVQAFAHQAATVLQRMRLFQAMQRRTRELESLTRISASLRSVHTVAEMLPLLAQHTRRAAAAAAVLLGVTTPTELITVYASDEALAPTRQTWPRHDHPFAVFEHAPTAEFLPVGSPAPASWPYPVDSGGAALLPLRLENQSLGFIYVEFEAQHPLENAAMQMLTAQADLAANALHRASLSENMERRIREKTHELEVLYQVASLASRSQSLEVSLGHTLTLALRSMGCHAGAIHLLTPAEEPRGAPFLKLAAHQGLPPQIAAQVAQLALGEGITGEVAVSGQLKIIPNLAAQANALFRQPPEFNWAKSLVCAPLRAAGGLMGAITILNPELNFTRPEDLALLATLADQMGVIVENFQLRAQAEQEAIAAERRRLGRDLHDSVAQSLYSVLMFTGAARNLVEQGSTISIEKYLHKIEANSQQALREMRLLIYELRPQVLEEEGLVGALQSRLEAVERRAGITAEMRVRGEITLPPAVEAELYRLAQEALNNALKHAAARHITVRLVGGRDTIMLQVCDDGIGFEVDAAATRGGQGLASLRERAARLGAQLEIHSTLGKGTCVQMRWSGARPILTGFPAKNH